ncbi:SDR family NAD(P)-dependent oxidoreductase [Catenuloplanes japonicus]|uniref:SDR family NAD(P)-dependent oxidoreductase n=1 Tax=Catenuloplanes japonicus TaxID=33876 RepID=UPI0012F85553|nr:SDR family NAD(P)-dependent oxidoreductase [Catenuloplanes japonicus]
MDLPLDRVDVVQPVSWAVMVSLAAVWESLGVTPAYVTGHSQGEIAAACVAGALTLQDAARVVALRSRALTVLSGDGGMVSVALPAGRVRELLADYPGLSVAAVNGPSSTVVSGDGDALDRLQAAWEPDVRVRRITVDYASHSAHVERIAPELLQALEPVRPRSGRIPFVSSVTGELLDTAGLDAGYWYRNLRQTVEFETATTTLLGLGSRILIEVSPHPVLSMAIQETCDRLASDATSLGTLRRDDGGLDRLMTSAAEAFVAGAPVRWQTWVRGRRVALPTYAFDRQRFWPEITPGRTDVSTAGLAATEHPLLGAALVLADGQGYVLTGRISLGTHPWLADHRVRGVALLPGTAFAEMALRAGDEVAMPRLDELALTRPLILPETGAVLVQVVVGPAQDGTCTVAIHSSPEHPNGPVWTRHATGRLNGRDVAEAPRDAVWPPAGADEVDVAQAYPLLADLGLEYGPAFRGLRRMWRRGDETFAEVSRPEPGETDTFGIHPALLDAALHAAALGETETHLPFAWTGVTLFARQASVLRVRIAPAGPDAISVRATDQAGAEVIRVDALVTRPVDAGQLGRQETALGAATLLRLEWTEQPSVAAGPGRWASIAGDVPGVPAYPSVDALLAAGTPLPEVVLLPVPAGDDGPVPAQVRARLGHVLHHLQAWLREDALASSRLVVVTRKAVFTGTPELSQAPVWGLVRTAQTENPGRITLVDLDLSLDGEPDRDLGGTLAAAIASGPAQVAVRDGTLYAPRLSRAESGDSLPLPAGDLPWRLTAAQTGTLENLDLLPAPDATTPLTEGQVRIGVRAAGVNFRDVLMTLGMYPGETRLGAEGAGVVTEVGPGVSGLAVGDRVCGLFTDAFGSVATADHRMITAVPPEWSFETAASVPVVFLTAYHALTDLAGLRPGQSLLVHAAAGGVGMAAVQIARHLGADVFATASPGKWDTTGVPRDRLASSRTLDFAPQFLDRTGGRGVDVVLNALAGAYVDASLRLLPRGGTFVELGRTDVRDPDDVRAAHPGVAYRQFELITSAGPDRVRQMLAELMDLFRRDVLRPLPVRTWDIRQAREPMRLLGAGRTTGKIVLTVPAAFDPGDGTVLITGGTGGLGAHVARHVAALGARHLLLLSRGGERAEGAAALRAELGTRVTIVACDVSDRDQLAHALDGVPLTAVVHTAGGLDDGVLDALTPDRIGTVLRPKADAAWHLHELTAGMPLTAFVLFSSASGTLGGAGQAGYAAANVFLDALARHRRDRGLPGLSLAWGLWADRTGLTSGLTGNDVRRMGDGMRALSTAQGLALLDRALAYPDAMFVALGLDLRQLRQGDAPPLLAKLVPARRRSVPSAPVTAAIMDRPALVALIRAEAAIVLGHRDPAAVDADRAFSDLGFDSLTAVELRNRLNTATGRRLPQTAIFDYPSVDKLADHLLGELGPSTQEQGAGNLMDTLDTIESMLADAGGTERAEAAARLRGLLATLPAPPAGETAKERLGGASAAEVLDFITNDLGITRPGLSRGEGGA